jgi:3-oxoacyl-[acyl-carrier protein] reductase
MDLGLSGKTAIVCASSHGLGRACATALAAAGCAVVLNGRHADALEDAAAALRARGATVGIVAGDVADDAVQHALVEAAGGAPDILVNNNAGPPLRDFRQLDADALHAGLDANMVAPIRMVQRVIDGMIERRFGRILCITSGSVKSPAAGLDLSSGARVGLTGFLAGVARQAGWRASMPSPPRHKASMSRRRRSAPAPAFRRGASAIRRSSATPAPSSVPHRPASSPGKAC